MRRRSFVAGSAALAAGALLAVPGRAAEAQIHELAGEVRVNGRAATSRTRIGAGDTVATHPGAAVWFTLGGDAFFLRGGSELRLQAERASRGLVSALRLLSGALGATFAPGRRRRVLARTVTIGIRGTGVYVATRGDETYACTCFGHTELLTRAGRLIERVSATHHAPRLVPAGSSGADVAGMEHHTDAEMARLERLAGRPYPFRA